MAMVAINHVNVISVFVIPMEQTLVIAVFVMDIKHQLVADVSTYAVRISIQYFRKHIAWFLAVNNSCNPATEICQTNQISGNATCSCLVGYGFNSSVNTCTGMIKEKNSYLWIDFQLKILMNVQCNKISVIQVFPIVLILSEVIYVFVCLVIRFEKIFSIEKKLNLSF
jgi:hypothetical protein